MDIRGIAHVRPSMKLSLENKKALAGFLFVLPAVCFFLVFFLYPVGFAVFTSFTKWDMARPRQFVGLTNYVNLLTDGAFLDSLAVTGYYAGVTGFLTLAIAFILALCLDRDSRLSNFFKAAFFFPSVLSVVVAAVLFGFMTTSYGLITLVGESLFGVTIPWQASFFWAMPLVIMMTVWQRVGFYMLIFLAGLKTIPAELYDAAKVDGVTYGKLLRRIIVPLMNPIILLALVLKLTEDFRAFAHFFLLTAGGPGRATTAVTLRIYFDGMSRLQMGKASAESMVAVMVMLVFTAIYLRLVGRETQI